MATQKENDFSKNDDDDETYQSHEVRSVFCMFCTQKKHDDEMADGQCSDDQKQNSKHRIYIHALLKTHYLLLHFHG